MQSALPIVKLMWLYNLAGGITTGSLITRGSAIQVCLPLSVLACLPLNEQTVKASSALSMACSG